MLAAITMLLVYDFSFSANPALENMGTGRSLYWLDIPSWDETFHFIAPSAWEPICTL